MLRYVDLFVAVWRQTVTGRMSFYNHEELKMAPNSVGETGETSQWGNKSGYE